uniref:cbb3-type cytochrome oxidase subunit 3 n=1 Tax=Oceanicola sp. S124 TaxID=1042378 RepID=UPI000255817F|nr:cbb3-type cytochrome c oxidase subunit 3 [Oceanicola sp. S124]
MLLALFLFFGAVVLWVFRPGARRTYQSTAGIPFRHEDRPAAASAPAEAQAGKDLPK